MRVPSIAETERLINEAEKLNPGLWIAHSKTAGFCAKAIAEKTDILEPNVAYSLGALHDIGRRYGITDMRHIIDGYKFMLSMGYIDCAKICITHSFPYKELKSYNGNNDCSEEDIRFIQDYLSTTEYDDYDRLIQLSDAISFPNGPTYIEKQLVDVTLRRGFNEYTIQKWKAFLELKNYFDNITGMDIYNFLVI